MKISIIDAADLAIIKAKVKKIINLLEDTIELNDLEKSEQFLLPALLEMHAKISRKNMPFLRYKELMQLAPEAFEHLWNENGR